ncbi:MAG: hypothetical protein LBU57_09830 [Dysgonamonadaceae bacterium]|jgi:hypothetical protein|nr:hypothetical protein [Dysgonamonadaceae bacterium]
MKRLIFIMSIASFASVLHNCKKEKSNSAENNLVEIAGSAENNRDTIGSGEMKSGIKFNKQ